MAEDTGVITTLDKVEDAEEIDSPSESGSSANSELTENEEVNNGETETKPSKKKRTKKEAQIGKVPPSYQANKESSKPNPKKKETGGKAKSYIIRHNPQKITTAIIPNPGYKRFRKEDEPQKRFSNQSLSTKVKQPEITTKNTKQQLKPQLKPETKQKSPKNKAGLAPQTSSKNNNSSIKKEKQAKLEANIRVNLDKLLKQKKETFPGEKKKSIKKLIDLLY